MDELNNNSTKLNNKNDKLISRQAAIDAPKILVKDCNPDHFVGHQKFIEFMDNAEIGGFGNWQFANGFNLGLTAVEVEIEKLPSAQPKQKKGKWLRITNKDGSWSVYVCSLCNTKAHLIGYDAPSDYCHGCGAKMEVEG